jgi:putative transposase
MSKIYYKRNLPHYQPGENYFFVTFRLANSLPRTIVSEYFQEKDSKNKNKESSGKLFLKFDQLLDRSNSGSTWLKDPRLAKIVYDAIRWRDKKEYELICFCIMPNHVHLVLYLGKTLDNYPLTNILRKLKSYTAVKCNECPK